MDFAQMAKDLQKLLETVDYPVYEGQAPRDSAGKIYEPPYIVYTAEPRAPQDEAEEWQIDLLIDVWALSSWANAYEITNALHALLDGTVHEGRAGTYCIDPNGLIANRNERDPSDERIRRLHSQYLIRFNEF